MTGLAIGAAVASLPPQTTQVVVQGSPYYTAPDGTYYQQSPKGYTVVTPPVGATVQALPSGAKKVEVGGQTLYVRDNTWYKAFYSGSQVIYVVTAPPG